MKKLPFMLFVLWSVVSITGCNSGAETRAVSVVPPAVIDESVTGVELYNQACHSCHGENGSGVKGYTQDMADSQRLRDLDETTVIAFMNAGHPATGLAEPELLQIIGFLRGIRP